VALVVTVIACPSKYPAVNTLSMPPAPGLPMRATQADAVHEEPLGQALLHEPQALLSVVRSTQRSPQAVRGDVHAQVPREHTSVPGQDPVWHGWPQPSS
jgi:hypothetical protein